MSAHMKSDWFERTIIVQVKNYLQVIHRLIKVSAIFLRKVCVDNGYELFCIEPGDVREDMDLFS